MRFVVFTRAGSDKMVHLDADRCLAVVESRAGDNFVEVHLEGGSNFLVVGSAETVMKTLFRSDIAQREEAVQRRKAFYQDALPESDP